MKTVLRSLVFGAVAMAMVPMAANAELSEDTHITRDDHTRLDVDRSLDVHSTVHFRFEDEGLQFVVTIRRGVVEVVVGEPLPGTPPPVATVRTDGVTWRRIALGQESAAKVIATGGLQVEGSVTGLLGVLSRFDRVFGGLPDSPP